MNHFDKKMETLSALQQLIKEREASQKRRSFSRTDKEDSIIQDWTLTQLHIVSAIKAQGSANNTSLSKTLNVSKPAITKAIRKMLENNVVVESRQEENQKEVYYLLTDYGEQLARIHERLHEQARNRYLSLLDNFDEEELETIITFLKLVTDNLKQDDLTLGE
ncbi:MarR family transcriptional regulator [Ornithinibacillus massiliensis]|uniref:MarR family transcriptional regulator n=1 Tax=Ornithinibacillus massiliensis TaxID=1944633 RepID=A0ABS5MFX1_9BACI|nr:MarR family transcriptional regulator [Ornithinibacillus massiliensis]MBS3681239.1 MarR family transcriptional regulator [Ornithinibacillus massiliensis]